MALVELGRFKAYEAYIVRGRLDSEGIEAVIFDSQTSIGEGSSFLLQARVMVDDRDLAKARAIIDAAAA